MPAAKLYRQVGEGQITLPVAISGGHTMAVFPLCICSVYAPLLIGKPRSSNT
ncbi:MAG: hypothetical protein JWM42_1537, partial [Burkholderia sp.]|nr:hypothetical protein [Burkholderia sp.]